MKDKRRNFRFSCLVPVEGKTGGLFDYAKAVDFSRGGLGFISRQRISLDREIAIELDLSQEGEPALVIGKVRWVDKIVNSDNFRIGVSFENILQGSKSRLEEYFRAKKVF
jgi:Tfp pilus assembly protein PilZ